jgi:rubrerythrin
MRLSLVGILTLLLGGMSFAGEEREFVCRHCGLKGTFGSGGGFYFSEFPAFCSNKDHFTSISWSHKQREPKPVRLEGKVPVYSCARCKTPTARRWNQTECPRCGSKHFKISDIKMFYD